MRSFSTYKFIIVCIAVLSLHTIVSATIPEARNVTINPAGPYIPGTLLTGSYTYFDDDGDAQNVPATEIGWYRSTSASGTSPSLIVSGTSTWTVTSGYRGSYVAFGVRVRDNAGEVGVRTYSTWYLINALPQAIDDNYSNMSAEGGTLNIPAPGVLSNDWSGNGVNEGQTLQSSVVTTPSYGTLLLNTNGSFTYTHDGSENHTDQFTYRIYDGLEYSASNATVHIQVTNADDRPVLSGIETIDLTYTEGDAAKVITSTLVVDDPDNDPIDSAQIRIIDGYVSTEDRFSYTPPSGLIGKFYQTLGIYSITGVQTETFYQTELRNVRYYNSNNQDPDDSDREIEFIVYAAGDSSETVSRMIDFTAVNDAPTATADNYSGLAEGGTLTVPAPGVLGNDTDPDGPPPMTAVRVGNVVNGTLTLNANGSFTYIHDGSNNLSDAFTYYADDGLAHSLTVTVNISLTNVNDPPVLANIGSGNVIYTEDASAVQISTGITVTDDDDANMESATVSFILGYHMSEDSLTFPVVPGLTIEYDTLTGVLTAEGTATKAVYQNMFRNIRYYNRNHADPSTALRRVEFIVNDGDDDSNPARRYIQILPQNDPPEASDAELLGTDFYVDELLTVDYTYTDPDGDPEGNTIFRWYTATDDQGTGRTQITGWNSDTATTRFSEGGKYLSAVVRPYDNQGTVGLYDTTDWYYINAAPEFEDFTIVNRVHPGAFAVDEVVSADFTYADEEDDPEGIHEFQWYRSNLGSWQSATLLTGETDTTLTITESMNDKYIALEGIPHATDGSSPGAKQRTLWFYVSKAPSATISGLDSICDDGSEGTLTVNLTGEAPWSFRYYIVGEEDTIPVTGIPEEEFEYELLVSESGRYKLAGVSDNKYEFGIVSGEGVIAYYPQPSATLPLDEITICDNDEADYVIPVNLTGKSPWQISYQYSEDPDSVTVTGIDDPTYEIEITAEDIGTYSVLHVFDANCMAPGTGTTEVLQKDSPIASMSGDTLVCPGDDAVITVDLTGNGPWTYYYTIDDGDDIAVNVNYNQASYSHKLTVEDPGIYRVVRVVDEDDEGCVYGTAEIGNHLIPTATLTGNDSTCEGSPKLFPVVLTGDGPWNITYQENTLPPVTINNIQSSPYNLQAYHAGNYRVLTVEDEFCSGTGTGIANLKVNPLPEASILGLESFYSLQTPEVPIDVEPFGGNFMSSSSPYAIFLNGDQWIFNTVIAFATAGSPFWIRYSYADPATGCVGMDEHMVFIINEAAEIQIENEKDMYCFDDDTIQAYGLNIRQNEGSFSITGNQGLIAQGDTAYLLPWLIGPGQKTLTYKVDIDGEEIQAQKTFNFGKIEGDFTWDNECLADGEALVEFSDKSSSNYDIVFYEWKFMFPGDTLEYSADSAIRPEVTFNGYGPYDIEYILTSQFNQDHCYDTVQIPFSLKPTWNIHTMPYDQSFTSGTDYWTDFASTREGVNSWKLGKPDAAIWNGVSASEKAWYTDIENDEVAENSYVISPCFNFTTAQRPMVKLDLWRKFAVEGQYDGAVLQYTLDNGNTWRTIGEQKGDGIEWYNAFGISGLPGTSQLGWSGISDNGWKTAKHKLDTLKGKSQVRFRVAYGNPDGSSAFERHGLAFDNFWIGEREKKVLIEHFTNASDARSAEIDPQFNALMNSSQNKLDIIDIQYHMGETSFGPDTFHTLNPVHPDSRALYYGISTVPYGVIDGAWGEHQSAYFVNYTDEDLDQNMLTLAALEENEFDIDLQTTKGIESVDIDIVVTARQAQSQKQMTLHVVVIENIVEGITGNNGETRFESVFKTMLPNAIGTPVNRSWNVGDMETFHLSYVFEDIFSDDQLRIVAFLQDNESRRIYQAAIRDPNAVEPVELPVAQSGSFSVYPNPARDHANIEFAEPLQEDLRLELIDFRGRTIYSTKVQAGNDIKTLSTAGMEPGIYIIRMLSTTEIVGNAKLVILGNNR